MTTADIIEKEMLSLRNEKEASHLMRFFKCGEGEYGEGDRFLGIRVPKTREIARRYSKNSELADVLTLVQSQWHEIRLAGFLLMIEIFKKSTENERKHVVDTYLTIIDRGNNWDLVDVVAPKLLGEWLVSHPDERDILYQLAERSDSLWHQRVAMVSTWTLIRSGEYGPTLRLALQFLTHKHDLMHKATGWMLREVGKRDIAPLLTFLDRHAPEMPRTMLRYAIEKLDKPTRLKYLTLRF